MVENDTRLKEKIDRIVYNAVFAEALVRDTARWLLWELGQELGIYPASIHELYMAGGRDELPHALTVPAINVRAMNFNTSRAVAAGGKEVRRRRFHLRNSALRDGIYATATG